MTLEKTRILIEEARETKASFLDLGDLGLREIPDEVFELKHLKGLNLGRRYLKDGQIIKSKNGGDRNIIRFIPFKIRKLFKLKLLSLNACYVIDIYNLREIPFLESLDLTSNDAIRDHSILSRLHRLKELSLKRSGFNNVDALADLDKLEYLNLASTRLSHYRFLTKLKRLTYLKLDYCVRAHDLAFFRAIPQLKHLSLNNIEIKELDEIARLSELESLWLGDCYLQDACLLENLKKLKYLDLWHNQLTHVDFIQHLPQLEELYAPVNQIKSLPAVGSSTLKVLDISQNNFSNLSSLIAYQHLQQLDISYATDDELRHLLNLPKLIDLRLRDMHLTEDQLAFLKDRQPLQNLDLRWNQIKHIPEWLKAWKLDRKNGIGEGLHLYGNSLYS